MSFWPDGRLLVAAHDAGGAEVVAAWLRRAAGGDYSRVGFALAGPAVKVFRGKLGDIDLTAPEEAFAAVAGYGRVLTGSGWGSDLELRAIAAAKGAGVRVAAYLDHWTSYRERFQLAGVPVLPDELWAGDEHACRLARETFPGMPVILEPNQYFADMAAEIAAAEFPPRRGDDKRVLYICEPRTMNYGRADYWGYTEYEALAGYLRYLAEQAVAVEEIRIRLHPAESAGKYDAVTAKFADRFWITESAGRPLTGDCAWADWVAGCDSMAMVIALLAGRTVYSCIPPGGRRMTLPYPEIIRLFDN